MATGDACRTGLVQKGMSVNQPYATAASCFHSSIDSIPRAAGVVLALTISAAMLCPAASLMPMHSGNPSRLTFVAPSPNYAAAKKGPACAPHAPVGMGRAVKSNRHELHMSGQPDDNGGLGGTPDFADVFGNTLGPMCPDAVSDFKLQILLLSMRLKVALRQERYDKASSIKQQISELRSQDTDVLIGKLHNVSRIMKENLARKRREHPRARLEHALEIAVAEQNFTKAGVISDSLRRLQDPPAEAAVAHAIKGAKASNGSITTLAILQRVDWVWLETEITTRVGLMKKSHEAMLRDTGVKLEHDISKAVEDQDFERAAELQRQLREREHEQQVKSMMRELERCLSSLKSQLNKLGAQPARLLQYRLQTAINAEDYEEAARLKEQLAELEIERMHSALQAKLKEGKRPSEGAVTPSSSGGGQAANEWADAGPSVLNSVQPTQGFVFNLFKPNLHEAARSEAVEAFLSKADARVAHAVVSFAGLLGILGVTWTVSMICAVALALDL